jgi:quercetin dioxygenase-like cupin family protein
MMPTKALISTLVMAGAVGLALLIERPTLMSGEVKAQELLVADLAGEPGREVNIQVYTFPPGASVSWHIHPDAQVRL